MERDLLDNVEEVLDVKETSDAIVEESAQEEVAKEVKEEIIEDAPQEPAKESAIDTLELANQVKDLKMMVEKLQASDEQFNQTIESLKSEITKMFFNGSGSGTEEKDKIDIEDILDDDFISKL